LKWSLLLAGGAGAEAVRGRHTHPQVVVPRTFSDYTTRRVLTTSWLEGEKLSQSKADDVSTLVNVGVVSYLKQLLGGWAGSLGAQLVVRWAVGR